MSPKTGRSPAEQVVCVARHLKHCKRGRLPVGRKTTGGELEDYHKTTERGSILQ